MNESSPILKKGFLFWCLPVLGAVFFIWMFQAVLLPFVLGIALAYLLNPLVGALHRAGIGRALAALLILLTFLLAVAIGFMLAVPALIREAQQFWLFLPELMDWVMDTLGPYVGVVQDSAADPEAKAALPNLLSNGAAGSAANFGKTVFDTLAAGGAFVTSAVMAAVLAPIAAYFMIKEWPRFTRFWEDLIPPRHRHTVMNLLGRMDKKIAGFVRGQLLVASVLAIFYSITLFAVGLQYGLLVGLMAGVLNIVPLLGSATGLITALILGWMQTGDWQFLGFIALVFGAGQVLEGYVLTPRLVGESIGMHPLWVFFAVLAGGSLAGIVGMLVAIPLAACLGVLMEFMIAEYKNGPYYNKKKRPEDKAKRRGL